MPGAVSRKLIPVIEQASGRSCGKDFGVCTNPEFLREASAVRDFFHPPMIVLGQDATTAISVFLWLRKASMCMSTSQTDQPVPSPKLLAKQPRASSS